MHAGGGGSARTSVSGEQTLTDTTLLRERRHRSGEQSRGRKRERERERKKEREREKETGATATLIEHGRVYCPLLEVEDSCHWRIEAVTHARASPFSVG